MRITICRSGVIAKKILNIREYTPRVFTKPIINEDLGKVK